LIFKLTLIINISPLIGEILIKMVLTFIINISVINVIFSYVNQDSINAEINFFKCHVTGIYL